MFSKQGKLAEMAMRRLILQMLIAFVGLRYGTGSNESSILSTIMKYKIVALCFDSLAIRHSSFFVVVFVFVG